MRQEVVIANPAIVTDDGLERSIIQGGLWGGVSRLYRTGYQVVRRRQRKLCRP